MTEMSLPAAPVMRTRRGLKGAKPLRLVKEPLISRAAQAPAAAAQQYLMIARASILRTQFTRVHPSPALRRGLSTPSRARAWVGPDTDLGGIAHTLHD